MLSSATIIGRHHRLKQQNCHDFATTYSTKHEQQIGLVLDGCGSKFKDQSGAHPSQNEVGAKLLGEFAIQFLAQQLAQDTDIQLAINQLYKATLSFLSTLLNLYSIDDQAKRKRLLYTHFLCTMLGFVRVANTAVFFWRGDGWLLHNEQIVELNANNHPDYLAYDLLNDAHQFATKKIESTEFKRLAVASDGWSKQLLTQLSGPQNDLMLQRWVNVQAREAGNFEDDGAIAIFGKQNPQPLAPTPQSHENNLP